MNKFNKVIAFGDSHVAGCELSSESSLDDYLSGKLTLEEADAPGKMLAFPQKLADKLNLPCENYALTGGSNDRSLRKLIEMIDSNSLVIFGYTSPDRKEFYYPDKGLYLGRDNDNFIQAGIQWTGAIDIASKKSNMVHPFNKVFLKTMQRSYDNVKDIYVCVDSICKAHRAHVLHLNMTANSYDFTDTIDGYSSYLSWCKDQNFKQLPFLHYGIDAHTKLSEILYDKILGLSSNS